MTQRPPLWCSPPRRRPELRSPTLTERRRCRGRRARSIRQRRDRGPHDARGEGPAPDRAVPRVVEHHDRRPSRQGRRQSRFRGLDCTTTRTPVRTTPTGRGPPRRGAAPPLAPGNPEQRTGKPDDAGQDGNDTDSDDTAEKPGEGRPAGGGRACRHRRPRSVGRAPAGRLTPLQTRRAVRRRYSQSRAVPPVPWSYRAASAARSWSSAATRSGSPAMLRYAAIVGP